MDKRAYNFAVGLVLIVLSVTFFALPSVLNMDAFIPFMMSIVALIFGIGFFFMGLGAK